MVRCPQGFVFFLFVAALLSACASERPYVTGDVPEPMRKAARIGCVTLHYSMTDRPGEEPPRNEARGNEGAICEKVLAKTDAEDGGLEILYGKDAWAAALPEVSAEALPEDAGSLAEAVDLARVAPAGDGLRYLVAMEVTTIRGKGQSDVEPGAGGDGGGGIVMLGYERFHDRTTLARALFFDLREGRELASMAASCHGKKGWFVGAGCCIAPPFVLPFVTPPIPYSTDTEERTLEAIGAKIASQLKR